MATAVGDMVQSTVEQFSGDCFCITLHRELGWGEKRVRRFMEAYEAVYKELLPAVKFYDKKHPDGVSKGEGEYAAGVLDRELEAVFHQNLIPFRQRYRFLEDR